jgi:hypothetical protein
MKTIILILDEEQGDWTDILPRGFESATEESGDRLVIQNGDDWLAVNSDPLLVDYYDEVEIKFIYSAITHPKFLRVEGRGGPLLNWMIMGISSSDQLLVDNDHGLISDIDKIRDLVRSGIDWTTKPGNN